MPDVLLVMRSRGNLKVLGDALAQHGYAVTAASSRAEVEGRLSAPPAPEVALVDVSGFRDEAWQMCEDLQRAHVAFLVISPRAGTEISKRSLAFGAMSVLEKPLVKRSLLEALDGMTKQ